MLDGLRARAARHAEEGRYSPVGIAFHWTMAALVIFQLGWGLYTDVLMPGGDKLQAYQVHAAVGLPILVLTFFRAWWRIVIPGPINDADRLGWKTLVAHATHILFYGLFALLPISGWAMWSAMQPAAPLSLAGLVPVPAMPFYDLSPAWQRWVLDVAEDLHGVGVVGLALLVPMHVGAALKHHFLEKHDVLEGILPSIPDSQSHPAGAQHMPTKPQIPPV